MKQKNNHFGRRLLTMLTALALTASLTACGSAAGDDASGENAETAKETVEEEQTSVPAEDATVQNENADGAYVTLEMEMAPAVGLYTPYYTNPDSFQGQLKSWADCSYTFTNTATGEIWNQLDAVYHPDEEAFGTGVFSGAEYEIPYAFYAPDADGEAHPLVIWLHGAGSGGTDIGFVTGGMLVTNFISDEVQKIFGGAHILLPQCETWWLDDDSESHYSSDGSSIYVESLKAMIDDYVSNHGDVDTSRIYVGGCSNGGFMTIAMNLAYPDYFAASFPVCEAYEDAWISDEEIETLKNIPT